MSVPENRAMCRCARVTCAAKHRQKGPTNRHLSHATQQTSSLSKSPELAGHCCLSARIPQMNETVSLSSILVFGHVAFVPSWTYLQAHAQNEFVPSPCKHSPHPPSRARQTTLSRPSKSVPSTHKTLKFPLEKRPLRGRLPAPSNISDQPSLSL